MALSRGRMLISPECARDGTDSIFQRPDTTLKGLIYQHSRGFEGGNIRAMDVGTRPIGGWYHASGGWYQASGGWYQALGE